MWAYYQRERAQGRTPTGAELDRVAGTNNYGRAVLARWRRTGQIPQVTPRDLDMVKDRNGRSPVNPLPVEARQEDGSRSFRATG